MCRCQYPQKSTEGRRFMDAPPPSSAARGSALGRMVRRTPSGARRKLARGLSDERRSMAKLGPNEKACRGEPGELSTDAAWPILLAATPTATALRYGALGLIGIPGG